MPTENGIEIQGEDINDFLSSLGFGCVLELQIKKTAKTVLSRFQLHKEKELVIAVCNYAEKFY